MSLSGLLVRCVKPPVSFGLSFHSVSSIFRCALQSTAASFPKCALHRCAASSVVVASSSRHLTTAAYLKNVASASPAISTPPASSTSSSSDTNNFRSLHSSYLHSRLRRLGILSPTEIQSRAISPILDGQSVLLGAETGCGKTLAYLLPILDRLLQTTPTDEEIERGETKRPQYPRVIIFQPNRELAAQLESVLESLLGESGSTAIPLDNGSHVRLHWHSLLGTQVLPVHSKPHIDILITTPVCLELNVPKEELFRARAKRDREELEASSPSSYGSRFDPVSFTRATEIVVIDEVDFLLEGGESKKTKYWIEDVWGVGSERRKKTKRKRFNHSNDADLSSTATPSPPALTHPQFIFVGATLANFSPLTSFQYLLKMFTQDWNEIYDERSSKSRPPRISLENLPKSCTLLPLLTRHFHHLDTQLVTGGTEWLKVGPEERVHEEVDLKALERLDARLEAEKGGMRRNTKEKKLQKDAFGDYDEDMILADGEDLDSVPSMETLTQRQLASQGKGGVGSRYFKPKNRVKYDPNVDALIKPKSGTTAMDVFEDPNDLEKLEHTIQWINSLTPSSSDISSSSSSPSSISSPPRKSLLFVSSASRLRALQAALLSSQSSSSIDSLHLSPHVELILYHAELKPAQRLEAMMKFNSQEEGGVQMIKRKKETADAATTNDAATTPQPKKSSAVPFRVTHQVLLCTSLVSRGLDFNRIVPPPAPRHQAKNVSSSSAATVTPGFTSLIQFDLATNVVEYIHRVGRMFRTRRRSNEVERPNTIGGEQQQQPQAQQPRVLNLYTAVDDLLVSRIRSNGSSSLEVNTNAEHDESGAPISSEHSSTPSSSSASPTHALGYISSDAFSRNRRLRHNEKRKLKAEDQMQAQPTE